MKRFLKLVAILMAFATVLGYLSFRILFFDPFEDSFENTEKLVPSNVHFMVRRVNAEEDFTKFPIPTFFQLLENRRDWRLFTSTEMYQDWFGPMELGAKIDEFEAQLAELEDLIDPLDDVLGREVMIMGRHHDDDSLGTAIVFRASNWIKLLSEAVRYGALRGLAGENVKDYREEGEVAVLTMADGTELALLRRLDLVVVGDDVALVGDIGRLADGEGQEFSLTESQYYTGAMEEAGDIGRPLDFALDVGEVARRGDWAKLEVEEGASAGAKWLAKTLVPGSFNLTAGRLHLGTRSLRLNVRASADMQQVSAEGGGFWEGTQGKAQDLVQFCANVLPSDVYACGLMRLDIDDFLLRLESCLESDTRALLADAVRDMSQRPEAGAFKSASVAELIRKAAPIFGDEVVFGFEPQSQYTIPGEEDPVYPEESWGPRVALMFRVVDRTRAESLVELIVNGMVRSGWKKFQWSYRGLPYSFHEMVAPAVPDPSISTGFVDLEDQEWLVITTTGQFLDEIVRGRIARKAGNRTGLGLNREFQEAVEQVQGYAQGFLYFSTEGYRKVMYDLNPWLARQTDPLDLREVRQAELTRLRDAAYPSLRGRPVSSEHETLFDAQVDQAVSKRVFDWESRELVAETERLNQELAWSELMEWTIVTWSANERDVAFRLFLRSLLEFP